MKRKLSLFSILAVLLGLWPVTPGRAADCQFVLGFQTLHDLIPEVVGECVVNVAYNPANGDGLQQTDGGLLVWRKADNFTAFTDGYRSWVNGPNGVQERLNTERFDWERDQTAPELALLAITSFTADIKDAGTGKQLTFKWETSGATKVRIWSGAKTRLFDSWEVPVTGTKTVDVAPTVRPNPSMNLVASDAQGNEITKTVTVQWPCQYSFFFPNPAPICPEAAPIIMAAAEQPFENGRMIWLKDIGSKVAKGPDLILVLYGDGKWQWFDDTWQTDQALNDPSITPPTPVAGQFLFQPERGFGKIWRQQTGVRDKLGWAKAPERGYTGAWQRPVQETQDIMTYVRGIDNGLFELRGDKGTGTWRQISSKSDS